MLRSITVVALFSLYSSVSLYAQSSPPGGPRAVERIEQLRKVRMIEALDLAEEQSVRFFSRLHEHEKASQELGERKSAVLDRLERLVRNRGDAGEYHSLFASVHEADEEIQAEDERFFAGLGDILSEEQQAKFLLFGRQFRRELQDALELMHRRRGGQ